MKLPSSSTSSDTIQRCVHFKEGIKLQKELSRRCGIDFENLSTAVAHAADAGQLDRSPICAVSAGHGDDVDIKGAGFKAEYWIQQFANHNNREGQNFSHHFLDTVESFL